MHTAHTNEPGHGTGSPPAVQQIIDELRDAYPGVVEEWERQRADGTEDWPEYRTTAGLAWWLDTEVRLTEQFIPGDETGRERDLQEFCLTALRRLRNRKDGDA